MALNSKANEQHDSQLEEETPIIKTTATIEPPWVRQSNNRASKEFHKSDKRFSIKICCGLVVLSVVLVLSLHYSDLRNGFLQACNKAEESELQQCYLGCRTLGNEYSLSSANFASDGLDTQVLLDEGKSYVQCVRECDDRQIELRSKQHRLLSRDGSTDLSVIGMVASTSSANAIGLDMFWSGTVLAAPILLNHQRTHWAVNLYSLGFIAFNTLNIIGVESTSYMNPASDQSAVATQSLECQSKIARADVNKWFYKGNDTNMATWNKEVCYSDASMLAERISEHIADLCGHQSEDQCSKTLAKLDSFLEKKCSYKLPKSIHSLNTGTTVQRNKQLKKEMLKIKKANECKLDVKPISTEGSLLSFETKPVALVALHAYLKSEKVDHPIVLPNDRKQFDVKHHRTKHDAVFDLFAPVTPYSCFGNLTAEKDRVQTNLWNHPITNGDDCPTQFGVIRCQTKDCIIMNSKDTIIYSETSLGTCCNLAITGWEPNHVLDMCKTKPIYVHSFEPTKCGSKTISLFDCREHTEACKTITPFSWTISAPERMRRVHDGLDKVVFADCKFARHLGNNKSTFRTFSYEYKKYSKCQCDYTDLCFRQGVVTIRLGHSLSKQTDRFTGFTNVKSFLVGEVESSIKTEKGDNTVIAVTNFGVTYKIEAIDAGDFLAEAIAVNDPYILKESDSDLYIHTGHSDSAVALRTENDDDFVSTSKGPAYVKNCLVPSRLGSKKEYDQQNECLRERALDYKEKKVFLITRIRILFYVQVGFVAFHIFMMMMTLTMLTNSVFYGEIIIKLLRLCFWDDERIRSCFKECRDFHMMSMNPRGYKSCWLKCFAVSLKEIKTSSKLVWLCVTSSLYFPPVLMLWLPINIVFGCLCSLISFIRIIMGYNTCRGKWCFITATNFCDCLSKLVCFFVIHCNGHPYSVKSAAKFSLKRMTGALVVVSSVAAAYYTSVTYGLSFPGWSGVIASSINCPIVGRPSMWIPLAMITRNKLLLLIGLLESTESAPSMGHAVNVAGNCKDGICTPQIDVTVNLPISSGAFIEYPLMYEGQQVGSLTITHKGFTREFLTTYKHTQMTYDKKTVRAVCKSLNGGVPAHKSCYRFRQGPLNKGGSCSGSDGGGNFPLGSDEDYLNIPMYCRYWDSKGFWWGLSDPNDGFEFLGQSFHPQISKPAIRWFSVGQGRLTGAIQVKMVVGEDEVFNEELQASELHDTHNNQEKKTVISMVERFTSGKPLGGVSIACLYNKLTDAASQSCYVHNAQFHGTSLLKAYGEPMEESGILDYSSFTMDRNNLGNDDGGSSINMHVDYKVHFADVQRDGDSLLAYTSCRVQESSHLQFKKACEEKCSGRSARTEEECRSQGDEFGQVCSFIPNGLKFKMEDCTGQRVEVRVSAQTKFNIAPSQVNVIDPNMVDFKSAGCWGVPDQLEIIGNTELLEPSYLVTGKSQGIDCSSFHPVRAGVVRFNCSLHFLEDAWIVFAKDNKTTFKYEINDENIKKCESYSFTQKETGSTSIPPEAGWSTWVIVAISVSASLFVLTLLLCSCCMKGSSVVTHVNSDLPLHSPSHKAQNDVNSEVSDYDSEFSMQLYEDENTYENLYDKVPLVKDKSNSSLRNRARLEKLGIFKSR